MTEQWGVGNKADSKAFDQAMVGKTKVDLIFGEHPYSRRDNAIYARFPDGDIIGFDGHRIKTKVEVETSNYAKTSSISGDEIRKSATCKIWLDDFLVYQFGGREADFLLRKAANEILPKLFEFPIQLWKKEERENIVGRKVYYERVPAIIEYVFFDQGCVVVKPAVGHKFNRIEDLLIQHEDDDDEMLKDDFLSDKFFWFRK